MVNTTDNAYKKVKVRFSTRDFMDYPIETEVPEIAAKQQVEVPLKPVFSGKILEVAENMLLYGRDRDHVLCIGWTADRDPELPDHAL